jgi:hypothetical protein
MPKQDSDNEEDIEFPPDDMTWEEKYALRKVQFA